MIEIVRKWEYKSGEEMKLVFTEIQFLVELRQSTLKMSSPSVA